MDAKVFGAFIAALRKENNLTQVELAKKLNVTDKAVSRWERGLGYPDIHTLEPLADALEISLVELMQSNRNNTNEPISTESAEKLLLNTIQLSTVPNRFAKILGFAVLSVFSIAIAVVLGVLLTDWDIVNYNAVSIISGLVALGIPVWKLTLSQNLKATWASVISFGCALIAIVLQLINMAHDIHINDVIAVIDTINGVVTVSCIFCVITVLLNAILLSKQRNRFKSQE